MSTRGRTIGLAALLLAPLAGCASTGDEDDGGAGLLANGHTGPPVAGGSSGPARLVPALYEAYDVGRSEETLRFADRFYRAPANEGFDATLEFVRTRLVAAGFSRAEGFELGELAREMDHPAWTPRAARLELNRPDGTSLVLHAFTDEADVDRVMLPENGTGGSARGEAAFSLEEVSPGDVLVTEARVRRDLIQRARARGAVAIVSASLASYNVDPFGYDRHLDAIQYRVMDPGTDLPVVQISPRSYARIVAEAETGGSALLSFEAEVTLETRTLRAVEAVVVGATRPDEVVVLLAHVDQPGASDNASGVASLLETAVVYAELIRAGELPRPDRSVAFLFGPEILQSEMWLEREGRTPVAALAEILTGDGPQHSGAVSLLERSPDPGALVPLLPDEHTAWGAGDVDPDTILPSGLNLIARCALADVITHVGGEWRSADHPWEGGTDHDVWLEAGYPAVLFWHFAELTYHTSLDRLEHVDPEEMRRTAVAVLAAALCVADPRPADLPRFLGTADLEEEVRVAAALAAGEEENAAAWRAWSDGVRAWLRELAGE